MKHYFLAIAFLVVFTSPAWAAVQCGPFRIDANPDGVIYVNGTRAKTQTVTFTATKGDYNNVKIHLVVKNNNAPGMLGMDHLSLQGKGTLKVEVIRTHSGQIRLTGFYDCNKV